MKVKSVDWQGIWWVSVWVWAFTNLFMACGTTKAGEERKESFYEGASRAIVRLEHLDVINRLGQETKRIDTVPNGTGFVVKYRGSSFMVTARHVAEVPYDLRSRVTVENVKTTKDEVVELSIPKGCWIFHPKAGSDRVRYVDIAVAKLPGILDRVYKVIAQNDSSPIDPTPPNFVLSFGYPGSLGIDLREQKPIGRMGIVSLQAEEMFIKMDKKYLTEKTLLLDIKTFPGNSGSPVFIYGIGSGTVNLGGVLIGFNENLDYAICEPISRVMETLDHAIKNPVPDSLHPEWRVLNE